MRIKCRYTDRYANLNIEDAPLEGYYHGAFPKDRDNLGNRIEALVEDIAGRFIHLNLTQVQITEDFDVPAEAMLHPKDREAISELTTELQTEEPEAQELLNSKWLLTDYRGSTPVEYAMAVNYHDPVPVKEPSIAGQRIKEIKDGFLGSFKAEYYGPDI